MADHVSQAPTQPTPEPSDVKLGLEVVALTTGKPVSAACNTGNLGAAPLQQNGTQTPVFKMKRTGHAKLPRIKLINTSTRNSPWSLGPDTSTSTSTTPAATTTSSRPSPEPEPARIVSDIMPPPLPPAPTLDSIPAPSVPEPRPTSNRKRNNKYATEEERRKATSKMLKGRSLPQFMLPRARLVGC